MNRTPHDLSMEELQALGAEAANKAVAKAQASGVPVYGQTPKYFGELPKDDLVEKSGRREMLTKYQQLQKDTAI